MNDPATEELERSRTEDAPASGDDDADREPAILDEVRIEEISIDGMCGVY